MLVIKGSTYKSWFQILRLKIIFYNTKKDYKIVTLQYYVLNSNTWQ